ELRGQIPLFEQNFSSSTNINDYFNADKPKPNTFNKIAAGIPANNLISIYEGKLRFKKLPRVRTGATFSRNTPIAKNPRFIKLSLELTVSDNTVLADTAIAIAVGSGAVNAIRTPRIENVHSLIYVGP